MFYLAVICLVLHAIPVLSNASDSPTVSLMNVTVEDLPYLDVSFDLYLQVQEAQIAQTCLKEVNVNAIIIYELVGNVKNI